MNDEQLEKARLIKSLMRTDRYHRAVVESTVDRFHLHRSQHGLLMFLSDTDVSPTQKEIADAMEISPAAVAVTLRNLESLGLIERVPQAGDARANTVALSEAGWDMVRKTRSLFASVDSRMLEGFSEEDLQRLSDYLTRIQNNLKNLKPELADLKESPIPGEKEKKNP